MRYSRIFFQVYLQDGSLYMPFIGHINFVFVFVSRQEKAFIGTSPYLPRSELNAPWRKKSTPECKYVVLLLPACAYASWLVLATMKDQDHGLASLVIPSTLSCSMASYHSPSSTQLSCKCVLLVIRGICPELKLGAGCLLSVDGPSSPSWTYQHRTYPESQLERLSLLAQEVLSAWLKPNFQMLSHHPSEQG